MSATFTSGARRLGIACAGITGSLMAAVLAWAAPEDRVYSVLALLFMGLAAALTSSVHFVILTASRDPAFAALAAAPRLLSFTWPSVAYALDILAWDVFFALAVLCAAPVFGGSRLALWIRWLLVASGLLSLAGLSGVVTGNMQLRNIGIVGYVGVFLPATILLGVRFQRTPSAPATSARP